jgi:RNA polymerase sigma-70 factor (ECF subfamily)
MRRFGSGDSARQPKAGGPEEFIPTRQSLLSRLKNWSDQESWQTFFDTYWGLIYGTALRSGLTDAEAQDVVQETVISVCKSMSDFKYDAEHGSFKTWLLRLTSWRIIDQLRKRRHAVQDPDAGRSTSTGTDVIERVADPGGLGLEELWEEEWERNLLEAAVTRVKKKVDPKLYQIFDLAVTKQWPVLRVARALNINVGKVYVTKHRIGKLIKQEIEYLRTKPI